MERERRTVVRTLSTGNIFRNTYESRKQYGFSANGEWNDKGSHYQGARSVFNLMRNNTFCFTTDYGVLSDVWEYIKGNISSSKLGSTIDMIADGIEELVI